MRILAELGRRNSGSRVQDRWLCQRGRSAQPPAPHTAHGACRQEKRDRWRELCIGCSAAALRVVYAVASEAYTIGRHLQDGIVRVGPFWTFLLDRSSTT